MDIYKQICAKLVEAWDNTADGEYEDFGRAASYLVDWTRAELAEPELEGSTPQPADGEVAELVAWMKNQATVHEVAQTQWAKRFVRAASLLERLSPPQPVPVSEPPRPEDCDAEGRCWWLIEPYPRPVGPSGKLWSLCRYCPRANYWLPANALPQPS